MNWLSVDYVSRAASTNHNQISGERKAAAGWREYSTLFLTKNVATQLTIAGKVFTCSTESRESAYASAPAPRMVKYIFAVVMSDNDDGSRGLMDAMAAAAPDRAIVLGLVTSGRLAMCGDTRNLRAT